MVISDDRKGLKTAVTRILGATCQRCRVHFMRDLLVHAGRQGRRVVSAFAQEDAGSASAQWRQVADQLRPKVPKLADLMDTVEHDVLASMKLLKEQRIKLRSVNPLERLNGEIKRQTSVVVGVRRAVLPLDGPLIHLTPQRRHHHQTDRRHPDRTERRMGGSESTIHDTGIDLFKERECLHQAVPRGSLKSSILDAGNRVKHEALAPRQGTRS